MPKRNYRTLSPVDATPIPMIVRAFLAFPLKPGVVWDIGCGPGTVLIESKLRYKDVTLIGVERNPDYIPVMQDNMARHGIEEGAITILNRDVCNDSLDDLARPDAIYLSCAGSAERDIIPMLWDYLNPGGAIVCNVSQYGKSPDIPNWIARLKNAQANYGGKLEDYTHWYDMSMNGRRDKWAVEDALHWEGQKPAV